MQMQTNDLGHLARKVRVILDHMGVQQVRARAVLAPDAWYRRKEHVTQLCGKFVAAPLGGAVTRLGSEGAIWHHGFELGNSANWRTSKVVGHQPNQPTSGIGTCSAADITVVAALRQADIKPPRTRGTQQNAACSWRKRRIVRLLTHHALQLSSQRR